MKCPKCATAMQSPVNADAYICYGCQLAFTGLAIRNNFSPRSSQEWFKEAAALFPEVLKKIKSGEII